LRTAGSLENIVEVSKNISNKVNEVKEVVRYIERLATQVEKAFVEMNKNLEEFSIFKARVESLDESVRELSRNFEAINARLENVATLKDIESLRTDIMSIRTQIDEINKVWPIAEAKLPETIKRLREERDDILLLLQSLETELKQGKISLGDYNSSKSKALEKLRKIEDQLIEEWKKVEKFIESGGVEAIPTVEKKEETKETEVKVEQKEEEKKEEVEIIKEKVNKIPEEKSAEDIGQKISKIDEFLRTASSLEDLVEVTKTIAIKINEVKEVARNIEKLATEVEKSFTKITKESKAGTEEEKDSEKEKIKKEVKVKRKIEPKLVEPVKVKGKGDVLKVLKKVKEVL
jgi:chromosome segregation ATPase